MRDEEEMIGKQESKYSYVCQQHVEVADGCL